MVFNRITIFVGQSIVRLGWGLINAILALTLFMNFQTLVKYHPYQLSYYKALIINLNDCLTI